jgi:type VI protein secretion system component Hcp
MTGNRATVGATLEAIMNKQAAEDRSKLVELSEKELDSVAGGEIHFTKTIDRASPVLFVACCTGKHFQS